MMATFDEAVRQEKTPTAAAPVHAPVVTHLVAYISVRWDSAS